MSEEDDFGKKTFKGVRGYLEYLGSIKRIDTFKNLEDFYLMVKSNIERIPVKANKIRAINKGNAKSLKDAFKDISEIDFTKKETYDLVVSDPQGKHFPQREVWKTISGIIDKVK